jgi:hypothetical protein
MSSLSQPGQVDPTYNKCLWTITDNSSLYILKCDEKANSQKPWRYLKLGKVTNCNYSKSWNNENGLKKVIFKLTVESKVPNVSGSSGDVNDSFSDHDVQRDVYIVQEHMYSDFRNSAPQNIPYLPQGPKASDVISEYYHKDKMNTTGNWLKKPLGQMGSTQLHKPTDSAQISFVNNLTSTPPHTSSPSTITSSTASSTVDADVFGSDAEDEVGGSPLSPGQRSIFNALFDGGSHLQSQGNYFCMSYVCVLF